MITREQAIQNLKDIKNSKTWNTAGDETFEMAIKALSQEPTDTVSIKAYQQVMWERDIAIEQLKELGYELGQKIEPCDDAVSRKDIQDYIAKYLSQYLYEDVRQAVEVIDAYIGDMPSVTQKLGKWIPVSERLPEDNGYYLTTTMYHEVYCDYWEEEHFNRTEAVIAWMPLPEPYEPQESEEISDRNMKMWEEIFKAESEG